MRSTKICSSQPFPASSTRRRNGCASARNRNFAPFHSSLGASKTDAPAPGSQNLPMSALSSVRKSNLLRCMRPGGQIVPLSHPNGVVSNKTGSGGQYRELVISSTTLRKGVYSRLPASSISRKIVSTDQIIHFWRWRRRPISSVIKHKEKRLRPSLDKFRESSSP